MWSHSKENFHWSHEAVSDYLDWARKIYLSFKILPLVISGDIGEGKERLGVVRNQLIN